ncbi:MAG: L-glyceraldehyde 3-phosphate reductase [Oscillospiraceae bacterium]|mgnify:FL=1|nr:L-glyceraldehyde 3-phosphate reductase [Oscillospiraceae bacterium]
MPYSADPSRYDDMAYRRVGRSGLKLPAVSLGIWQNFGSVTPYETSRAILLRAFDLGVTHIDAANNYGPVPGSAEETLGRVLKTDLAPYRDELIISTKAGYGMWPGPYGDWGSRKYMLASLDQSLKRLGLEYVDIFYSHRPDPETPLEETMGALASAVRAGKALYVGVSNYSAEQTRQAAAILRQMGVPCLIHQPRYNMFDRWIEDGLQDVLDEEGMGSIAFSPLAQGLLTDRYLGGIPADSRAARGAFLKEADITPARLDVIRKLNGIAAERGQSLAQMAIAWILRGGRVTSALVGASSVGQLENNLGALRQLEFTADELAAIEAVLA